MTATQLALGIFFGFGSLEIFKVLVAVMYDNHKRRAIVADMNTAATDFIDKMHADIMAERAAELKKSVDKKAPIRRKPATKPTIKKAPAKKSVAKKAGK